jgi:hypothetical protein
VFASQVQIERNVLWVLGAMERLPGERRIEVFFTDGDAPTPDLHEWSPPPAGAESLQPLALVFDDYWSNGLRYRNHRIPGVAGPTEAAALGDSLGARLRAMGPGDDAWLIFSGHGTLGRDLDNRLELWNGTRLSVSELGVLLEEAPAEARVRFLLTQCYSGAFAALAEGGGNRCGFMAAAQDRVSEGCSPAVEKSDYEDYATYFFAALTGRPRDHAGLDGRPDRDLDGLVTPLEAHFHVLVNAFSADIPRSTSEVLLMRWRADERSDVLVDGSDGENEYREMARETMRRAGIAPEKEPGREMYRRQEVLRAQWADLERERRELRGEIVSLQAGLRREVLRRWPRAAESYTLGFKRFLEQDLEAAQDFIEAHPDFPGLVGSQEAYWAQEDRVLRIRREQNRLQKIGHLLRLARLKADLERDGPRDLLERFQRLRECESAPF